MIFEVENVETSVIRLLEKLPEHKRQSPIVSLALNLAREIDSERLSSPAPVAREFRECLAILEAELPNNSADYVNEMTKRRKVG